MRMLQRANRIKMIKEKYQNYSVVRAAADFYRHNEIKGLAQDSIKTYTGYVEKFIEWCGVDTFVSDVILYYNIKYIM